MKPRKLAEAREARKEKVKLYMSVGFTRDEIIKLMGIGYRTIDDYIRQINYESKEIVQPKN